MRNSGRDVRISSLLHPHLRRLLLTPSLLLTRPIPRHLLHNILAPQLILPLNHIHAHRLRLDLLDGAREPLARAEEPEADAVGDDDADGDGGVVERLGVDGLWGRG